jgi:hypothetical protein
MNGIFSRRGAASVIGFAAIAVAVAGCDSDAAYRSAPSANVVENIRHDPYQDETPNLRSKVDAVRGRRWVLTSDGVELYETSSGRKLAQIALPEWLWVSRDYACPPDLAIGPRGEAVITSNVVPTLWRVDPISLVASKNQLAIGEDTGKDVGITALMYSPQQGAYFAVSGAHGSLWRIDTQLQRAQSIPLPAPLPRTCALATPPREADRRVSRAVAFCIRGEQGDLTVTLAPDQRSGYVRAGQCMS